MLNLEALLNSFGKDFYKNNEEKIIGDDFLLYDFLVSLCGNIKLADKPEYSSVDINKSIKLVNEFGVGIDVLATKDVFDGNSTIKITYDNDKKIDVVIDSYKGILCSSDSDFFITEYNNVINYYGKKSIDAYKALSGESDLSFDTDFNKYGIDYDDFCFCFKDMKYGKQWECNVGSFIRSCIIERKVKSRFHLSKIVDSISDNLFEDLHYTKPIYSFSLYEFLDVLYKGINLRGLDAGANYKKVDGENSLEKDILLKNSNSTDLISVVSNSSVALEAGSYEKTLEMLFELNDSKIYTTLSVNNEGFSFVSKRVINQTPDDGMMDCDRASIIVGDLNGARYYNAETIDDYTKLVPVAFKVEINSDEDFGTFFVEPDDIVEFDECIPLDKQIALFIKNHFYDEKSLKKNDELKVVKKK